MAKIEMAQMVRPAGKTKPRDVSSDNATAKTDFAQMLKGKDQAVQENADNPKTEEKADGQMVRDAEDGQKREDDSQVTQKDAEVQVPAEIMIQLQAALNQLMVNQMPETGPVSGQMAELQAETEQAEEILSEVTAPAKGQEAGVARGPAAEAAKLSAEEEAFYAASQEAPVQALPVEKDTEVSGSSTGAAPEITLAAENEGQIVITVPEQSAHKQAADQDETQHKSGREHDTETVDEPVYTDSLPSAASRAQFSGASVKGTADTVAVKTTPETFPADVGKAIAAKLPGNNSTLTIELEPAALGKMTIKVVYEAGRAAVSIMSANPKTLELLSQSAGDIAQILEEKTGQETVVYTPDPQQDLDGRQDRQENGGQRHDRDEERKQNQPDTFAQQLRLGLV